MATLRKHLLLVISWLLVAIAVPLFVCMPINCDTALYDLQARSVLSGKIAYRDIIEPNLPGALWLHLLIRPWIGWSSEAIRIVDFAVVCSIVCLLFRFLSLSRQSRVSPLLIPTALLFYLTRNEWCHCQRDTWMLLPAIAALYVRLSHWSHWRCQCLTEGVLWGLAFWMKPHIAIPAIAVVFIDSLLLREPKLSLQKFGYFICGGLLAAIPGICWLWQTGCWADFWDMMLNWNPEYLQAGKAAKSAERLKLMLIRFSPWWMLHLIAIPIAGTQLWTALRNKEFERRQVLLGTTYLAWFFQSAVLQHLLDYIHVPALLLAVAVIGAVRWSIEPSVQKWATASLLLLTIVGSPMLNNIVVWKQCLTEGSSIEVKSRLAHGNFPAWSDLDRVANFLRQQNIADGQLTSLNVHSVHLFNQLKVLPSTRYWCVTTLTKVFPSRKPLIMKTVMNSGHKFVVTEANESRLGSSNLLPSEFPWNLPVVFQSGSYKVHLIESRLTKNPISHSTNAPVKRH